MLLELGREQEAETLARRALDIWHQSQTPNDPRLGKAHWIVGAIAKRQGDTGGAKEHLQEALRLLSESSGQYPSEIRALKEQLAALS